MVKALKCKWGRACSRGNMRRHESVRGEPGAGKWMHANYEISRSKKRCPGYFSRKRIISYAAQILGKVFRSPRARQRARVQNP